MKQRWLPVAVFAVVLFVVNVVTRLVVRFGFDSNPDTESRATLVMFSVIGLMLAVAAFVRSRQVRPGDWLPEITAAALGAMLLTILVGPFISGDTPFGGGAGDFFAQVWFYGGFAIVGTVLGYWIATALGVDYRSKSLQAFEKAKLSRPRRVVRR